MGSPPYVKNLRTPEQAKARAAQEELQAAPEGIPAPASIQGTSLHQLECHLSNMHHADVCRVHVTTCLLMVG